MSPTHFKVKSLSGKIFTSVLAFTLAVIVALSVGTSEVQNMLNAIPEVVTNGLNIAGGMIVVVGYAMVST